MRESLLKYLGLRLDAIIQYFISLNYYGEVIEDLDNTNEKAKSMSDEFQKKIKDEEYIRSIDYYEQRALAENAQNYKATVNHINSIVEQLIAKKFTRHINQTFYYLDDMRLALKDMLSGYYDLEDINKNVKVKAPIDNKKFEKAKYKTQLSMIQAAIATFRDDIRDEKDMFPEDLGLRGEMFRDNLLTNLGKIEILLQEEIEEIEANGMPDLGNYELPELVVPEIPEGPEEEVEEKAPESVQKTIEFEAAVKGEV